MDPHVSLSDVTVITAHVHGWDPSENSGMWTDCDIARFRQKPYSYSALAGNFMQQIENTSLC